MRTAKTANTAIYVELLGNTKWETKEMVKKNKTENAFESYRYIIAKGKNATAMHIKDVEACIAKWIADMACPCW